VPSIFTPLEDTRMARGHALKPRELTQLQWEFILTAWSQSLKFAVVRKRSNLAWKLGMRAFYYGRGRWIHGTQFKYPAFRFAGIGEDKIAPHLYLQWNRGGGAADPAPRPPRMITKHADMTVDQLNAMQNNGGTLRVLRS